MQREYGGQPAATRAHDPRRVSWGLLAGIAALVVPLVAVVAVLLASRDASLVATDVRPEAIAGDPAGHLDQSVVTSGFVQEMLTEHAMTISRDAAAEPVLVLLSRNVLINGSPPITGTPLMSLVRPDDPVQLFGTVGSFERQAMAEQLGLVLHEELFAAWEGAPVIMADQIDTAPLASVDPAGAT